MVTLGGSSPSLHGTTHQLNLPIPTSGQVQEPGRTIQNHNEEVCKMDIQVGISKISHHLHNSTLLSQMKSDNNNTSKVVSDTICENYSVKNELQWKLGLSRVNGKDSSIHVNPLDTQILSKRNNKDRISLDLNEGITINSDSVSADSTSKSSIQTVQSLPVLSDNANLSCRRCSFQQYASLDPQMTNILVNGGIKKDSNGNHSEIDAYSSNNIANSENESCIVTPRSDPSSPSDLIKRCSLEISELQRTLQETAQTQSHHKIKLHDNLKLFVDLQNNSELLNSSADYTSQYCKVNEHNTHNSSKNNGNESLESNSNRRNSSSTSSRFPGLFLCHGCSSPLDNSPPLSRHVTETTRDDDTCIHKTPKRSMDQARQKSKTIEKDHKVAIPDSDYVNRERINYYPKCDPTIWIRSCTQEVIQPLSGDQSGVIPKWLRGALIRNGPGRVQVGESQYNHVFDGSALLHRFHFRDGEVTYQNKFLESQSYLRDTKAQRIVVNYFGTRAHPDPCKTILQNIASKFTLEEHFTDNAQISLYPYGDGLYALTETPFMYRVDPDTLHTHEKVDLTQHVAVLTHTAHPHVDRDGTIYNIGQGVGPLGPRYHICKFPNTKTDAKGKTKTPFKQATIVGSVGARWFFNPCYMHSFAMTENYWIIMEQPLVVSVPKMLRVLLKQDALIDALQWWEKETKIHVLRRDTGRVISTQYVTETFFFLHTINAYEDQGHIVLDISAYKNAEMLQCMFVEALKNAAFDPTYAQMFRGRPKRWVLPLAPHQESGPNVNLTTLPHTESKAHWVKRNVVYVTPELLADIGCEVPRIYYEEYNGRHYQYFYAICSDVDHPSPGTLVKVDVVNKRHIEWSEDNVYPSEPIFVPSPHAKREDEGVVLCALLRAEGKDCEVCLLVLNATTFTEMARVEFNAPSPVPKCLHGWFVPEGSLTIYNKRDKIREEK